MHDRRDDRSDCGGSRHGQDHGDRRRGGNEHGHDHRDGPDHRGERGCDRPEERGDGPDTRFLQMEMSEVLYSEAESVTKQALRDLLLEEAKARFRDRFGDEIRGLAQLAVDELMEDVLASLDIEERIQEHNRTRASRRERLAGILGTGAGQKPADEPEPGEDTE